MCYGASLDAKPRDKVLQHTHSTYQPSDRLPMKCPHLEQHSALDSRAGYIRNDIPTPQNEFPSFFITLFSYLKAKYHQSNANSYYPHCYHSEYYYSHY